MPWATAIFTLAAAIPLIWILHEHVDPLFFAFIALVSWGGGWLMAFYMWRLNDAMQYETGPLRPAKRDQEEKRPGDV
jgi:hypothetical protein